MPALSRIRPPRLWPVVILSGILLTGCTTTYTVVPERKSRDQYAVDEKHFEDRFAIASATVITKHDSVYEVTGIRLRSDSLQFGDQSIGGLRSYPVGDIRQVVWVDHWGGAISGFFLGGLAGGLVGNLAVRSSSHHGDMYGLALGLGTIEGAGCGAIFGLVMGGLAGHTYRYEFPPERKTLAPTP